MAISREGYIDLHDATLRLMTIGVDGVCKFTLVGVSRFRHLAGSLFTREVFNATLALSGCESIEVTGSWAASDNYVMDATIVSGDVEQSVWPDLPEEVPVRRVEFSLFSGAKIKVQCASGAMRLEGEALESGEWLAE